MSTGLRNTIEMRILLAAPGISNLYQGSLMKCRKDENLVNSAVPMAAAADVKIGEGEGKGDR